MSEMTIVENTAVLVRAEIDSQVATAKAYPRDLERCFAKAIKTACFNQRIAQSCIYSKPVDGKQMTGASIRLAEIMISAWGNMHCSTRLTKNDGKFIAVEGIIIDRETNVIYCESVERSIMTSAKPGKDGKARTPRQYSYDMQQNTAAAAASIALRKAAFRLFGKEFVEVIYEAARAVALGAEKAVTGETQSFEVTRTKAIEQFAKNGIPPMKIFEYFGVSTIEELDMSCLETMVGIKNAIMDKTLAKENAFNREYDMETGEVAPTKADDVNSKLAAATPAPAVEPMGDLAYPE